jgi:hypothetical protein
MMKTQTQKEIDERLLFNAGNPDELYIKKNEHKYKRATFSVRFPIYQNQKRTTRYIGRYNTMEEAIAARDYAIKQVSKSSELSLTIPPEISKFKKEGEH